VQVHIAAVTHPRAPARPGRAQHRQIVLLRCAA
jgi:hypothetical protein